MPDGTPRARTRGSAADITLVTHSHSPGGEPDDRLLADALARRGARVRFAVWDDPDVDWAASPVTLVRSPWDYHLRFAAWSDWIDRAEPLTRLLNSPAVLRWSSHKGYLLDLAKAGVATLPTRIVRAKTPRRLIELCRMEGWDDIVVKPIVGAGAHGARRFRRSEIEPAGQVHLEALLVTRDVLVQPYTAAVETVRERSLVFLDGRFSHGFLKTPFSATLGSADDWRPHVPDVGELALAAAALAAAPAPPAYARVDLVASAAGPLIMELELVEPDLALRRHTDALAAMASLCLRQLDGAAGETRSAV